MFKTRPLLILGTILVYTFFASAQEHDLSWLKAHSVVPNEPLHARFDNYSRSELDRFRSFLETLKETPVESEWDGLYVAGGENATGYSTLRIKRKSGYSSLYIDTCMPELLHIDFGSIRLAQDTIELVPEVQPGSPRKAETIKLVKVRWTDRYFLVAERSLGAFAEKSVGIFVPREDEVKKGQEWWNFWEMGDLEVRLRGKPQLPARYRHLERSSIAAKIVSVQPRRLVPEFSTPRSYHTGESVLYGVTISAGSNQGVKRGLILKLDGTYDEVTVMKVSRTSSQAVIVRAVNESTRADHCLTDDAELIRCPRIKQGMRVSTEVGNFLF